MTPDIEAKAEAAPRRDPPPPPPPEAPGRVQISVRNLDFHYGDFHALRSITMDIPAQRITAFIGPSGCGKSTLLRVFNRMYSLYPRLRATGEVLLDGRDILAPDLDLNLLRARVGMVFQRATPFPMSIQDNISFGVKLYERLGRAAMDERVEKVLRQAALWDEVKDKLRRNAFSLSGGQQQRLCIARAIAVEPEVILLDEPTSALDPLSTGKIEELLEDLKTRYTILIVTHNMQQAARISDFTAFLLDGRLVEHGRTDQVFRVPGDKRTEDYVRGLNPAAGAEEGR